MRLAKEMASMLSSKEVTVETRAQAGRLLEVA
jgi:DNA repair ATPase RecN